MTGRRAVVASVLALVVPAIAFAQAPGRTYRIAVWHVSRPIDEMRETGALPYRAFFEELRRLGFVEGRNLAVARYATEGRTDRYEATAREIVDSRPDVIIPNGVLPARLLRNLTATIPIVSNTFVDPIASGLLTSLARPGGNLTGFSIDGGVEIAGLRLQMLKEVAPRAGRLGFLTSRNLLIDETMAVLKSAAGRLNVDLVMRGMDGPFNEAGYRAILDEFAREGIGGLYVDGAGEFLAGSKTITRLVNENRWPAIYAFRDYADDGGLLSYGANLADNYRKAAGYVARVLNGENPGDLPVQQPTTFDVIVNLKTAAALGITIPETVFFRATEVIE